MTTTQPTTKGRAMETTIKITDISHAPTEPATVVPLTEGLVTTIVLGDLSLEPGWVRSALESGVAVESAGRTYQIDK